MYTTLIFLLGKLLLVGWMCVVPLQGQRPGQVDPLTLNQADPQCWESSSGRLLEMRSPRIADTVPAFWNLMVFLKASDNRKHSALFWDLAQVFWDTYVDCILSRTHGLGRRQLPWPREQITAMHSLITDKSIVKDSKTNSSKLKESSQSLLSVQVQRTGSGILRHIITHAKDEKKKSKI
ncbi:protein FAM237A-like [Hypomesus transpacificus]|uniref:protein FAM237A-like n=1 Tax=Hypomesus transpacificus TaxID=137520 RepID=UPI001F084C4F|nr:protein FAM237A-like [Hypomesus transpacificus]